MADELLRELIRKIEVLVSLTAIGVLDGKNQREQIEALSRAGLGPKEISDLLGTSPNTVSVTLSQLKRAKASPRIRKP